jgi:hypothetical protein
LILSGDLNLDLKTGVLVTVERINAIIRLISLRTPCLKARTHSGLSGLSRLFNLSGFSGFSSLSGLLKAYQDIKGLGENIFL